MPTPFTFARSEVTNLSNTTTTIISLTLSMANRYAKMRWWNFRGYQRAPSGEEDQLDESKILPIYNERQEERRRWVQCILLSLNVLILCGNIAFTIKNLSGSDVLFPSVDFIIPPLRKVISYDVENTDVGIGITSVFGLDTPEADEKWKEISQDGPYGWVTVQKEDLDKINQTSVKLEDGSGYLVGLEVFHELHCLNWFRRKVMNKTFEAMEDPMPEYHLAHCVDILRLSIQCHADLSLMPLRWVEDYPFPWPVFQTSRQCRNWDDIMDWTKANSIGAAGRTVHPQLGPVKADQPIDPKTLPRIGRVKYLEDL